jgi:hypothetical protein
VKSHLLKAINALLYVHHKLLIKHSPRKLNKLHGTPLGTVILHLLLIKNIPRLIYNFTCTSNPSYAKYFKLYLARSFPYVMDFIIRFVVLSAVVMNVAIFWVITQCSQYV